MNTRRRQGVYRRVNETKAVATGAMLARATRVYKLSVFIFNKGNAFLIFCKVLHNNLFMQEKTLI
ncbi:hypothetical protein DYU05_02845 [Mucilaginibacter terrenus]|uniref:Uncharacterized protein n=1 Tax=Mucilaginibacter terrenus TaxID=2482727 RepID=A0A3E2NUG7_9SPHI|nr:hypothetical protein [Mucilaginibacter terrenus]RFZ84571.1 hypothetical protein DYU05_02845 [Mucilaginibacter terrenus]